MFSVDSDPIDSRLQIEIDKRAPATGDVDDRPGQRLIEWRIGTPEPGDAAPITERLIEGGAEGDAAVLNRVVVVDFEVPAASQHEIETGVPGQSRQQVVEEADPGVDVGPTRPIEGEVELDGRFRCFSLHVRLPGHGTSCDRLVTTTSLPPAALMAGMSAGSSRRGTAARTA